MNYPLFSSTQQRLPGCGFIEIWSHRGHLDAAAAEMQQNVDYYWTCDTVLQQLHTHDIRSFDIDIIYYNGQSIVVHPTEAAAAAASGDYYYDYSNNFIPSPCSRLPLVDFLQKVKTVYEDYFYITMEPKSSWKNSGNNTDNTNKFLSQPQNVMNGIMDVLDQEPIPNRHCAIILSPLQLEEVPFFVVDRIKEYCDLSMPIKRDESLRDNYPLWLQRNNNNNNNIGNDGYQIVMPTIELFLSDDDDDMEDRDWFLQQIVLLSSSRHEGIKNLVWVVDTRERLHTALQLPRHSIHGVISNNPVQLIDMYEEICQMKYEFPTTTHATTWSL